jgi:hypothetical protein
MYIKLPKKLMSPNGCIYNKKKLIHECWFFFLHFIRIYWMSLVVNDGDIVVIFQAKLAFYLCMLCNLILGVNGVWHTMGKIFFDKGLNDIFSVINSHMCMLELDILLSNIIAHAYECLNCWNNFIFVYFVGLSFLILVHLHIAGHVKGYFKVLSRFT